MKVWSLLEMRPGFELFSALDSEHFRCARSCPKVFLCFNIHNARRWLLLSPSSSSIPLLKREECGTERLSTLPKVTQLATGTAARFPRHSGSRANALNHYVRQYLISLSPVIWGQLFNLVIFVNMEPFESILQTSCHFTLNIQCVSTWHFSV